MTNHPNRSKAKLVYLFRAYESEPGSDGRMYGLSTAADEPPKDLPGFGDWIVIGALRGKFGIEADTQEPYVIPAGGHLAGHALYAYEVREAGCYTPPWKAPEDDGLDFYRQQHGKQ